MIDAVLPVPGPPVMTDSRCSSAALSALACSSVRSVAAIGAPPASRQALARLAGDQLVDRVGELGLELGGGGPVDPLTLANGVTGADELLDAVLRDLAAEQLTRICQHRVEREAGVAAPLGLRQDVHDRGALAAAIGALRARGGGGAGDPVGDHEADPEHAGELIRGSR